jgi:hypothetical protein
MGGDLRCPSLERRSNSQWRRKCKSCSATVSANIVLVGAELSAFSSDSLEILLSWCVCIANLEKKALFANGLAVELLNDFLADITALKSIQYVSRQVQMWLAYAYLANPTPRLLFCPSRRILLELTV